MKKIVLLLAVVVMSFIWPGTAQAADRQLLPYADVNEELPAAAAIYRLTMLGVVNGDGEGLNFYPGAPLTRAQMAVIACRLNGVSEEALRLYATANCPFRDVSAGAWFRPYVSACADLGLMQGAGGRFRPADPVTREQALTVCLRALGYNQLSGVWPNNYLQRGRELGLMDWKESDQAISRAELAQLVSLTLDVNLVYHIEDENAAQLMRDKGLAVDNEGYVGLTPTLLTSTFNCRSMVVEFSAPCYIEEQGQIYFFYSFNNQEAWAAAADCYVATAEDLDGQQARLTLNNLGEVLFIETLVR